ncbi:MAG: hypothetical protein WC030_02540 [Candidatus Paceibacterota bacterium]
MQQIGARGGVAYWIVFVVVALGVLALGISWRYGWFPFAASSQADAELRAQLMSEASATAPSNLSDKEREALITETSASASTELTEEERAALIKETTAL